MSRIRQIACLLLVLFMASSPVWAEDKVTIHFLIDEDRAIPGKRYDEAITVEVAAQSAGATTPKANEMVTIEVLFGPVQVALSGGVAPTAKPQAQTDANGLAKFALITGDEPDLFALEVKTATFSKRIGGRVGSGFQAGFASDLVASEFFLGSSFGRSYDEEGKSNGFDESSIVALLRVDTNWGRNDAWNLHTGLEVMFSSFPAEDAKTANDEGFEQFGDAFTGALAVIYQPGRWAFYTPTSHNRDPKLAFDARRLGIVMRTGIISRDNKAENGDTDIAFSRIGFHFEHHQTAASSAKLDNINVFPMRFVELTFGRYEEIFGQEDANRFVLEAGMRLPALGNDRIPFYAGIYLNAGEGQDDLRIFAGLLFELDALPKLFM